MSILLVFCFFIFSQAEEPISPPSPPPPRPPPPSPENETQSLLTTVEPDECNPETYKEKVQGDQYCLCMKYNFLEGEVPYKIYCVPNGCTDDQQKVIPIGEEGKVKGKVCKCLKGHSVMMDAPLQYRAHWDC